MKYALAGFLSYRPSGACFLIPFFSDQLSNDLYTHELDELGLVRQFHKVEPANYFVDHRAPSSISCELRGPGIFAARLANGGLVWGAFIAFREKLSAIDLAIYGSEFFNIDVYSLLGDLESRSRAVDHASKLFSVPHLARAWSSREKRLSVVGLSRPVALSPSYPQGYSLGSPLPDVSPNQIAGLIETIALAPFSGKADIHVVSQELQMGDEELFPMIEVVQHLGFAELAAGEILLTAIARSFAEADTETRKKIFSRQLLAGVPLAAHIKRVLDERPGHCAPRIRFEGELEDYLSDTYAEETLDCVIHWGRYAEIFDYDIEKQMFVLEITVE